MAPIVVRNRGDARKVGLGDSFIIDVFPSADEEDQTVTQQMLVERDDLAAFIADNVTGSVKENPGKGRNR